MSDNGTIAAKILLDTESVALRPDEPFTLTSGKKSPVYVDIRRLIAFPKERRQIMGLAAEMLASHQFDAVAGGETAGIPYAAWLADSFDVPMAYIRKKPKGFGKNARIEGEILPNQNVLLVEDLATDGGSKISFVEALREVDAICHHCFVVFYYGIFKSAEKLLSDAKLELHYLATWHDILKVAEQQKSLSDGDLAKVKEFLDNPEAWQAKNP